MTNRNITQRGNTYLVEVMRKGVRHRVTCATMAEAYETRDHLETNKKGESESTYWTLGEATEKCRAQIWKGSKNERSSVARSGMALLYFGKDTLLDEITTDKVDAWIASLQDLGNKRSTVNRKLSALGRVLSYARQRHHMKTTPYLGKRKEPRGRERYLTQGEEATVLSYLSQWGLDCHAEAVCVLADTGLRSGELWRLEARDLNFSVPEGTRAMITVYNSKTDVTRSIPMTTRVREILQRRAEVFPTGPVFDFDNDWMRSGWSRVRAAMNLQLDREFVPYALRHTCCTRLMQRGVPLHTVKVWMGHANILMTDRYSHHAPNTLADAAGLLEDV